MARRADAVLGYSIRQLCLEDPDRRLRQTAFTQPALLVVGALAWLERRERRPELPSPAALAGHSLGELSALFAAGCFDFETGLRLVTKRGALMAEVEEGAADAGMAAVLGLGVAAVRGVLAGAGEAGAAVDVANFNLPEQLVLSGPRSALGELASPFEEAGAERFVMLNVSGAFHSRAMVPAAERFERFVEGFHFEAPKLPVIANATAEPYPDDPSAVAPLLARQIRSSVRWSETLEQLWRRGVREVEELGARGVLTRMWRDFASRAEARGESPDGAPDESPAAATGTGGAGGESLGAESFRRAHGARLAYVAGSTARGVRTVEMAVELAEAGLVAIADARDESGIAELSRRLRSSLPGDAASPSWGVAWRAGDARKDAPGLGAIVRSALRRGVPLLEVGGLEEPDLELVRFRFSPEAAGPRPRGLFVLAGRPEVAERFLRPAPQDLVERLGEAGDLDEEGADLARRLPLAGDLCLEGDPDSGLELAVLLPEILERRRELGADSVRIGAGGVLGTPAALASAFLLGADFVRTGALQLTMRASGLPPATVRLLEGLELGDTTTAPAAESFALGGRRRVVRKGSLFAARAQKLYDLLRAHDSLDEVDAATRERLEGSSFGRSWREIEAELAAKGELRGDAKTRMARVFAWYLERSLDWMLEDHAGHRLDFQIPCDESLAAFNAYWRRARGGPRTAALVAERLMGDAARLLDSKAAPDGDA